VDLNHRPQDSLLASLLRIYRSIPNYGPCFGGYPSLVFFKGGAFGLISYAQSPRRENSDKSSPGEVQ
jgi:hypothetical protein